MKIHVNNRTIAQTVLMMSFLLVLSVNSHAGMGEGKMHGEKKDWNKKDWEEKVNKMYDKLGLSEEQRSKLKEHKQSHRTEMKTLHENIKTKKDELHAEIQKADFNESKVKSLNNELKSLHNQMADHRINGMLEVRQILTPEQFGEFNKLKGEHRGKWKEKFKEGKEHRRESKDK